MSLNDYTIWLLYFYKYFRKRLIIYKLINKLIQQKNTYNLIVGT